jgi:hypothetical protein
MSIVNSTKIMIGNFGNSLERERTRGLRERERGEEEE